MALLHYTSSELKSSPGKLRELWQNVKRHIEDLSTDRQRLLKRSMSMIKLGDQNGNLLRNIMFDMFTMGKSSAIRGSTAQAQTARSSYQRWIKNLSRRYRRDRVITPELLKILSKGKG